MAVLHASAVNINNKALIFAGKCGAGKSTLVAGLQRHGFSYLSDDICPLEPGSGNLIPVPMCQTIKCGSWQALSSWHEDFANIPVYQRFNQQVRYTPPVNMDQSMTATTWPVRALIFPQYNEEGNTRLHPLPYLEALALLTRSGTLAGDRVWDLADWLGTITAYRLDYTEISTAAEALYNLPDTGEA